MVFNSWSFLPFFLITLVLYYAIRNWRSQKALLLLSSYVFYGFFHPPYVLILIVSTLIDFFVSRRMDLASGRMRKVWLMVSLTSNLGMLAYFKYANFFLENFTLLMARIGLEYDPPGWNIILPVGISYYTFQTLSYTIDVYRRRLKPSQSLLDFGFFVAFFPQLVAGPIVRAVDFMPQTQEPERARFNGARFGWGLHLLIFGLFGKIVLADRLFAPIVDSVYASAQSVGFLAAWIGTISFSGQIFFDFAGYSTSAIGVAMCYGFALPDNFRFPYAAAGFSDFWRRWHISLSEWLRDYLYISLGGNRLGVVRTYFNLAITMLLGGLWHGAAWTFVIWGALHGAFLVLERLLSPVIGRVSRVMGPSGLIPGILITYVGVCFAWVFFRARSFSDGFAIASAMVRPSAEWGRVEGLPILACIIMGATLIGHGLCRNTTIEAVWARYPALIRAVVLGGVVFLILATRGEQRAFIYFQF